MANREDFLAISDSTATATQVIQAQFITSFVLQLLLSGALSMLWNIFNNLQILLALNLFYVKFPGNVTIV